MASVLALVHGKPGAFGVSYPDFPGCVSGGKTISEALQRAPESLLCHIEAMMGAEFVLPDIRELDAIKADGAFAEDFASAAIVAAIDIELPGKVSRLNISMDERLVARIDKRARELGESRSGFLATAAKSRLATS